jgi:hypothetical protein
LGYDPYLLSMFYFKARIVINGFTLSSGIFKLERLCYRFIFISADEDEDEEEGLLVLF